MANLKNTNFYYSFNELLSGMSKRDAEALKQGYLEDRLSEDLQAKSPEERAAVIEAAKRGSQSFDMGQQFNLLQKEAEAQGYQAVFSYDKTSKIIRTHLIPLEEKNILDKKTKGGKSISSSQLAKKYPTIQQAIEVGGFIDRYGQRGINALYLDTVDENAVIITAQQKMLDATIKSLKTKSGQKALKTRDKKEIERISKSAQSKASQSMNVAGAYVPLSAEAKKSLSGTGSPEQLRNRRSTLHYDTYLSKLVKDNFKDFLSGKDRNISYTRYGENVQNGLNLALNIMSQYRDDPQKAFEIISKEPSLKFLTQTSGYKKVRAEMMQVAKMGLNIGLSGDKAFQHQEATLLPHAGTVGGFAEPSSSKKQQQIENYFLLNRKKIKEKEKLQHTRKSRIFSAQEVSGKHSKKVKDIYNRLYGVADVTLDDVAAVLGDEYLGIGLDGIALAEDVADELHGIEIKSGDFSKSDYDKKFKELSDKYKGKKTPEQIKKDVVKSLLNIKGNFDINKFKLGATGNYSVEYGVERDVKEGTKFLLEASRGRSSATFITRKQLEAILKHAGYSDEDIASVSGIRQASTIKGKNISGVLTEALELVFSEINKTDASGRETIDISKKNMLMDIISKNPDLAKYIKWDAKKGVFLTQGSELSLKEGEEGVTQINSIIKTLNEAYKAVTSRASGLLEWAENIEDPTKSGWVKTKNFIGRTAIRQMAETPYGAPGGEVVSVDYRARGAIDRTLGMMTAQAGETLDDLHTYLKKATANTEEDAKRFKRISDDAEEAKEKTLKTLQDNFKVDAQKDVVFGWGEQYGEFNLENFVEADEEMKQNRTSSGAFRADLYAKSSLAAIQRAKEYVTSTGGTLYFDPQMGYQTVTDEKTGKTFGGKLAAISTFEPIPIYDENGEVVAYTVNENKASAFNKMAFAAKRAVEDPSDIYNQYASQDAFIDYFVAAADDVISKEGTTYAKTHKKRLTHSAMTKSVAANYSTINGLVTQIEKETDPVKRAELQQQLNILTGSVQMSEADVATMLDINSRQTWDETAGKYVYKKETETDKNTILKTYYDQLYGVGEAEKFGTTVLDEIKNNREKMLAESAKRYQEELENIEKNRIEVGDSEAVDVVDEMGNVVTRFFMDADEKADYFKNEARIRYEERNKGIAAAQAGELTDSAFNQALIQKIVEAVTIGSEEYNRRLKAANGGTISGLYDILTRFPYSSGLDTKYTDVFINKKLSAGASAAGLGIWQEINGDNDGDKMANFLALADADALKSGDPSKIIEQMHKVVALQHQVSEVVGVARAREEGAATKGLTEEEIAKFSNQESQRTSAILSRLNKGKTGQFSNEYQAVTEAMSLLGVDETGVGSDFESQMRAAKAMITRGIFESLTQDAISSKKVADRISEKYKDDGGLLNEDGKFYSELDQLIKDLTEDKTYKDEKSLQSLLDRLTKMGILGGGDDAAFATRINSAIVKRISQYSNGEAILRNLFGDEVGDDFQAFQRKIDKGEVSLKTGQLLEALLSTNTSLSTAGGIGAVIRNRYYNVPGMQSAERNPAASLGINITADNKAFTEYNKTLKETKELADQERSSEERKIVVANKEAAAILNLAKAYGGLYGSLSDVEKVDKMKLLDELLDAKKWNEDPIGITGRLQKQFGITYEDLGLGRTVSHFLQTGTVALNGKQYKIKDFDADAIKKTDVAKRVWLDEAGKEIEDQELIKQLNRLGYDEDTYKKVTRSFGALSYGNITHTTSEMMQDLGLRISDLGEITKLSDFQKIIENRIAEVEKTNPELAKSAREKWEEQRQASGYGGGTPLYAQEYAEALRTVGKSETEIDEAIAEKIKIGAQFANAVSEGGRLETLSEQKIGVPDADTLIQSSIDNIAIDKDGNIIVTDYKTKSGAIKGNELAQVGRYTFALQGAAAKIAEQGFGSAKEFMESGLGADFGFTQENPMSEALFGFLQRAIEGARKDIEEATSKMSFSSETDKEDYIQKNLDKYIFDKFSARILQGNKQGGASTFLSSSLLSKDLEGVNPADRAILEKVFRGGSGAQSEISDEEEKVLKKYGFYGQGVYDRWGDLQKSWTAEGITPEQKNESQKEYNTLVSEEFKLKKEIAALDKERWKLTDIEGKKSADYAVQNLDAEKQWRQDELKRMQDRKAELEGLGAVESKATTASNEEKMTAYLTRLGVGADGKMALTPEEQADYWSQYERALDKQARAKEEIAGLRNKAVTTTYHTEKDLLYQIADAKERGMAADNENVAMLEKIVGKLDPTRLANIKEQVALNQQLYKLQALKQTRGATSIWDVMANDIRRAAMRIADFGIAAKVLNKIPQDIQKVIQYTKELDAAMTNIRIVSGKSMEEAQEFMRGLQQIAQKTGTTLSELASAANEWLDDCLGHYKLL